MQERRQIHGPRQGKDIILNPKLNVPVEYKQINYKRAVRKTNAPVKVDWCFACKCYFKIQANITFQVIIFELLTKLMSRIFEKYKISYTSLDI